MCFLESRFRSKPNQFDHEWTRINTNSRRQTFRVHSCPFVVQKFTWPAKTFRESGPDCQPAPDRFPPTLLTAFSNFNGRNLDRKSTRLNSSHLVISYAV